MGRMNLPDPPASMTITYGNLKGVDYSVTPVEVSRDRSPDMLNMISDEGGNPVKRKGWRNDKSFSNDVLGKPFPNNEILDIHSSNDAMYLITKCNMFRKKRPFVTPDGWESLWTRSSGSVEFINGKLFSFDGIVYAAGEGIEKIETTGTRSFFYGELERIWESMTNQYVIPPTGKHQPTVPEIVLSRKPNGTGGSDSGRGVNLLTNWRTISFLGDSSSTKYQLYPDKDLTNPKYKHVYVGKVETMNSNGEWVAATFTRPTTSNVTGYDVNGKLKSFTVHAPYITLSAPQAPVVTGQDNVRITYLAFDETYGRIGDNGEWIKNELEPVPSTAKFKGVYNEHLNAICRNGIIKNYGYSANDRLFMVADRNRVYYTAANDPQFIPDNNYITVSNTSKIMGLHRFDKFLVAITKDTEEESSLFFISGEKLQDGTYAFSVAASAVTTGVIAKNSFTTLIDEPLFLSRYGVYSISNHYLTSQLALRNRSTFINKRLKLEENIEGAIAYEWNNYAIIAINDKCYILDGRKAAKDKRNNTDYSYECYVFNNIPASTFGTFEGELYFAKKGSPTLCKFNTDIDNVTAYRDDGELGGDGRIIGGAAIKALWTSVPDSDGRIQLYKTMSKKGNAIVFKTPYGTSVSIYASVDGKPKELIQGVTVSGSDFQTVFLKKKIKKYKTLQFILECNNIDEPFGLISITKTYTVGNYAK